MSPVGYIVDYTREQHERPSRLYVGAGHLEQQIRAWTVAHLGRPADITVVMDSSADAGVVLVDGCRVARVAVRPHVYPAPIGDGVRGGEVVAVLPPRTHLVVSGSMGWSDDAAPCRVCDTLTQSRDAQDRPIHGSCAARLVGEQIGRRLSELVAERFAVSARTPGGGR